MAISHIPNPEQAVPNIKYWIGWHIGWATGWWNPFDKFNEIDPREVGILTTIQADFLAKQVDVLRTQAELVREMGEQIASMRGAGQQRQG
jgi:hypothetical protein